jgi:uracil-DNA glycosylase
VSDLQDILREACDVIQREAAKRPGRGKGMVSLAPETAEKLPKLDKLAPSLRKSIPSIPSTLSIPSTQEGTPALLKAKSLDELEAIMRVCHRCSLGATRKNLVFGSGNPHAKLVFVGEAPGQDEDLKGKPFVGRAGQLLTDIIEKGMKIKRSDVYICNVLKCRPPDNRNPLPDEIEVCEPYLIRQLELIQPKVICVLGKFAAQTLLKSDLAIGRLRGRWHFYHGIPLRATFHPAYLLRSPGEKGKCWEDIQEVMKLLSGDVTPVPE